MRNALLFFSIPALLAGCAAVGPNYVTPVTDSPSSYASPVPADAVSFNDATSFWASFSDAELPAIVSMAVQANYDIRIAAANLREVRALRREVRGGLFPRTDLQVSATKDRESLSQLPGTTISQRSQTDLNVEFDSAWELDLFGGIRRSVEAASAQVGATQADLEVMKVSVAAETARTYFELRGLQRRIDVAQRNLRNQLDTLDVITKRFNAGRGTDFDVSRARGLAETTRSQIPRLEADLARTSFALDLLTARVPGATSGLLEQHPPTAAIPPPFILRDPALMLRHRPDVSAAERRVAAASASIGVNTAALFPSVTLIGNVALTATRGSDLSKGDAVRYSVGPALSWNLLDFGRIRSRIEQADARYDVALAAYEQSVLRALQEADGAIITAQRLNEQAESILAATSAARSAARLATLRFEAGATDLLDLLDAQRQVLSAEDSLTQVETAKVVASVALFKAMGGTWQPIVEGDDLARR